MRNHRKIRPNSCTQTMRLQTKSIREITTITEDEEDVLGITEDAEEVAICGEIQQISRAIVATR